MPEFVLLAIIMVLGLGAYWSLVTFPKQREFQKRQRFVRALGVGDEVITAGGIIGKVVAVDGDKGIAHVEIAEGVVIRLVAAAMLQAYDPERIAQDAQQGIQQEPPPT